MKTTLIATLFSLTTSAIAATQLGQLKIDKCWARPGNSGKNTAAYMIIENEKLQQDKLVKAECSVANTVELHNHIHEDGIMKMRPVNTVEIKEKTTEMKPGGLHVMLMGLKQDLKENDQITIKLTFEKAGSVELPFTVKTPS
jgi:periplasmic copper chaperone A